MGYYWVLAVFCVLFWGTDALWPEVSDTGEHGQQRYPKRADQSRGGWISNLIFTWSSGADSSRFSRSYLGGIQVNPTVSYCSPRHLLTPPRWHTQKAAAGRKPLKGPGSTCVLCIVLKGVFCKELILPGWCAQPRCRVWKQFLVVTRNEIIPLQTNNKTRGYFPGMCFQDTSFSKSHIYVHVRVQVTIQLMWRVSLELLRCFLKEKLCQRSALRAGNLASWLSGTGHGAAVGSER